MLVKAAKTRLLVLPVKWCGASYQPGSLRLPASDVGSGGALVHCKCGIEADTDDSGSECFSMEIDTWAVKNFKIQIHCDETGIFSCGENNSRFLGRHWACVVFPLHLSPST